MAPRDDRLIHQKALEAVNAIEPDAVGCRIWQGKFITDSPCINGRLTEGGPKVYRRVRVLMWENITGEEVPATKNIGTTCDDEACVEPEHLAEIKARRRGPGKVAEPIEDRIDRYLAELAEPDANGCQIWHGPHQRSYPYVVGWTPTAPRKHLSVRNIVWERAGNEPAQRSRTRISTTCGTPLCVAVGHLVEVGNVSGVPIEKRLIISAQEVLDDHLDEIAKAKAGGATVADLANWFGVTRGQVIAALRKTL